METEQILFSKYHILKVLKQSEKSRVLLVSHVLVGDKRIVKEILKDEEGCESLHSEVNILKNIHFSGIPQIYDIEENEKYYYMIEEYVEGRTLCEVVEQEGPLQPERAAEYTLKLANIIKDLHDLKPKGILHLDIQPKNIMICNQKLFLLDFGNAAYAGSQEKRHYLKGTPGFAAPEQYDGSGITFATDIYGIGACLAYMLNANEKNGGRERIPGEIREIFEKCMKREISARFSSVEVLCHKLHDYLYKGKVSEITKKEQEGMEIGRKFENYPKTISVAGVMGRIGTSYLAMAFTSYLTRLGFRVSYEENNDSDMVRALVRRNTSVTYQNGYFYYADCALKPKYNKNVSFSNQEEIIIRDEGIFSENGEYSDFLVLVAGVREWEEEELYRAEDVLRKKLLSQKKLRAVWLFNFADGRMELPVVQHGVEQIYVPYLAEIYDERGTQAFEKLRSIFELHGSLERGTGRTSPLQKNSGVYV